MTVLHVSTELSGGAGGFVKNLHLAMLEMGMSSLVLTRERANLAGVITIKPFSRVGASFRARALTILNKFGFLDSSYALFGIEKCPVVLADIQPKLKNVKPSTIIFYWTSYFINFKSMLELSYAYPDASIVLVCTDEAFLTGGCHYSNSCKGYMHSCTECPATSSARLQQHISEKFVQKKEIVDAINPIVIYPTSNIQVMGRRSSAMKDVRSHVVPLGVVTPFELNRINSMRSLVIGENEDENTKVLLLIRSSSEYRKGCDLFVEALKILNQQLSGLRNVLKVISIGDDALVSAGICQYVDHISMGLVSREQLLELYGRVDMLLVTSREDGGPLMINESIALNVFVISTPVGVAKDLIIPGVNGQITKNISSEAIAESLRNYIERFSPAGITYSLFNHKESQASLPLTFDNYIQLVLSIVAAERTLH